MNIHIQLSQLRDLYKAYNRLPEGREGLSDVGELLPACVDDTLPDRELAPVELVYLASILIKNNKHCEEDFTRKSDFLTELHDLFGVEHLKRFAPFVQHSLSAMDHPEGDLYTIYLPNLLMFIRSYKTKMDWKELESLFYQDFLTLENLMAFNQLDPDAYTDSIHQFIQNNKFSLPFEDMLTWYVNGVLTTENINAIQAHKYPSDRYLAACDLHALHRKGQLTVATQSFISQFQYKAYEYLIKHKVLCSSASTVSTKLRKELLRRRNRLLVDYYEVWLERMQTQFPDASIDQLFQMGTQVRYLNVGFAWLTYDFITKHPQNDVVVKSLEKDYFNFRVNIVASVAATLDRCGLLEQPERRTFLAKALSKLESRDVIVELFELLNEVNRLSFEWVKLILVHPVFSNDKCSLLQIGRSERASAIVNNEANALVKVLESVLQMLCLPEAKDMDASHLLNHVLDNYKIYANPSLGLANVFSLVKMTPELFKKIMEKCAAFNSDPVVAAKLIIRCILLHQVDPRCIPHDYQKKAFLSYIVKEGVHNLILAYTFMREPVDVYVFSQLLQQLAQSGVRLIWEDVAKYVNARLKTLSPVEQLYTDGLHRLISQMNELFNEKPLPEGGMVRNNVVLISGLDAYYGLIQTAPGYQKICSGYLRNSGFFAAQKPLNPHENKALVVCQAPTVDQPQQKKSAPGCQ